MLNNGGCEKDSPEKIGKANYADFQKAYKYLEKQTEGLQTKIRLHE